MQTTYQLAKPTNWDKVPFGPLFTLDKAQDYQAQMLDCGVFVWVINTMEGKTLH